jgi:hypothetical protein
MKYMADEMLEGLPEFLREKGIDCRTPYEWIDGTKEKRRTIRDWEIRKFLGQKNAKGEAVTLVTIDGESCEQVRADDLPVIFVPELVRDYILSKGE